MVKESRCFFIIFSLYAVVGYAKIDDSVNHLNSSLSISKTSTTKQFIKKNNLLPKSNQTVNSSSDTINSIVTARHKDKKKRNSTGKKDFIKIVLNNSSSIINSNHAKETHTKKQQVVVGMHNMSKGGTLNQNHDKKNNTDAKPNHIRKETISNVADNKTKSANDSKSNEVNKDTTITNKSNNTKYFNNNNEMNDNKTEHNVTDKTNVGNNNNTVNNDNSSDRFNNSNNRTNSSLSKNSVTSGNKKNEINSRILHIPNDDITFNVNNSHSLPGILPKKNLATVHKQMKSAEFGGEAENIRETAEKKGMLSGTFATPTNNQDIDSENFGNHVPVNKFTIEENGGQSEENISTASVLDHIIEINYPNPVDDEGGLFEGDIIRNEKLDNEIDDMKYDRNSDRLKDAIRNGQWPNGVIPYTFSTRFSGRRVVEEAVRAFKKYTCLIFRPRVSGDRDYVEFLHGGGCSSYIGRQGGRQQISLAYGCLVIGIAIHEMMHAAGFFHEQSRRDRDQYIMINWSNINRGMYYNFQKYRSGQASTLDEPYDKKSVMHYGNYAFSVNGRKTIVSKSNPNEVLGQRKGMSQIDINQINKYYKCKDGGGGKGGKGDKYKFCYLLGKFCNVEQWVLENCPKTCCKDSNEYCDYWMKRGYCKSPTSGGYMKKYCRKSCGYC